MTQYGHWRTWKWFRELALNLIEVKHYISFETTTLGVVGGIGRQQFRLW